MGVLREPQLWVWSADGARRRVTPQTKVGLARVELRGLRVPSACVERRGTGEGSPVLDTRKHNEYLTVKSAGVWGSGQLVG